MTNYFDVLLKVKSIDIYYYLKQYIINFIKWKDYPGYYLDDVSRLNRII